MTSLCNVSLRIALYIQIAPRNPVGKLPEVLMQLIVFFFFFTYKSPEPELLRSRVSGTGVNFTQMQGPLSTAIDKKQLLLAYQRLISASKNDMGYYNILLFSSHSAKRS